MYNGYANEDSYYFDMVWSNDRPLYEAIVSYGKHLLDFVPGMSDQTLGLNVLHAVKAAAYDGGWGYASKPTLFRSVSAKSLADLTASCDLSNVDETEFGANVRDAVNL